MSGSRTILASLTLLFFAVPGAAAWNLASPPSDIAFNHAAWTTDLIPGLRSQGSDVAALGMGAATCALGDVNDDQVSDLLVRVKEAADGPWRLKALAGPTFNETVWQVSTNGNRLLECAPDLDGDGVHDPVTTLESAASQAQNTGSNVKDEAKDKAMQVLNGVSGIGILQRQNRDTNTSAGSASASGQAGVAATSQATANLMPAVSGAEALVKTELQQTGLIGLPTGLPVDALTATARHTAEMQILDATGSLEGTVAIDQPGVDPLALAPIPVGGTLPQVAALTAQTVSPVKQAASQVPTLSIYNPDGTLAWATQLDATQGLPMLVPRAGDLNLDGAQELIVEAVPTDVAAGATGQFQVLSGIDGSTLLSSGAAANGLVAALPLGEVTGGAPGLLKVQQLAGASKTALSALDSTGKVLWSLDVDAAAIPINIRPDAYTGDPLGFTDLTGDGLPDVGTAVADGSGLALQAIDGVTGKVVWTANIAGAASVVPMSLTSSLGMVTSTQQTLPSDLLAIGNPTNGPAMSLIDGTAGHVVWTVKGALPSGAAAAALDLQAAGDLNADGVQDVLATMNVVTSAAGGAVRDDTGYASPNNTTTRDTQVIYAISGTDGSTLYSNGTDPSQDGAQVDLASEPGPGYEEKAAQLQASEAGKGKSPGLEIPLVLLGVVALAMLVRARRRT